MTNVTNTQHQAASVVHPHTERHKLAAAQLNLCPPSLSEPTIACRFASDLRAPALAFLWDHVVAGRSIMPGAGMMEFTTVQGRMLAPDNEPVCLLGASIPGPIVLSGAAVPPVEGSVDCRSGAVELQTHSASGASCSGAGWLHCCGAAELWIGCLDDEAADLQCQPASSARCWLLLYARCNLCHGQC